MATSFVNSVSIPCSKDLTSPAKRALANEVRNALTVATATYRGPGREGVRIGLHVSPPPGVRFLVTRHHERSGKARLLYGGINLTEALTVAKAAKKELTGKGWRKSGAENGRLFLGGRKSVRRATLRVVSQTVTRSRSGVGL